MCVPEGKAVMRGVAIAWWICVLCAQSAAAARVVVPVSLDGEWVGQRDGATVIWTLDPEGRLRVDGRGASYAIHGDTLCVQFDPPTGEPPGTNPETAIYRFTPDDTATRLFVYGFDLGKQGVLFFRNPALEPPDGVEDAASELPAEPVPPSPPAAPAPPPGHD